jgi:hypothetical protein
MDTVVLGKAASVAAVAITADIGERRKRRNVSSRLHEAAIAGSIKP